MNNSPESNYDIIEYFEEFLKSKKDQRLIKNLTGFSSSFVIAFKDISTNTWTVTVDDGILMSVSHDTHMDKINCRYLVSSEAFRKIIMGKLSPQKAFFKGDVDIKGDIRYGLKLASLMEIFFKENPYVKT
jgi:putative sterol carrier protein